MGAAAPSAMLPPGSSPGGGGGTCQGVFPSAWAEHGAGMARMVLSHSHPCPMLGQLGRWPGSSSRQRPPIAGEPRCPAQHPGPWPSASGAREGVLLLRPPPATRPCSNRPRTACPHLLPHSGDPSGSTPRWGEPSALPPSTGTWRGASVGWDPTGTRLCAPGTRSVSGPEEPGPYTSLDPLHLRPHRPHPIDAGSPTDLPRAIVPPAPRTSAPHAPQASSVQDPGSLQHPLPHTTPHAPYNPDPPQLGPPSVPCSSGPTPTTSHRAQTWTWVPYTPYMCPKDSMPHTSQTPCNLCMPCTAWTLRSLDLG